MWFPCASRPNAHFGGGSQPIWGPVQAASGARETFSSLQPCPKRNAGLRTRPAWGRRAQGIAPAGAVHLGTFGLAGIRAHIDISINMWCSVFMYTKHGLLFL